MLEERPLINAKTVFPMKFSAFFHRKDAVYWPVFSNVISMLLGLISIPLLTSRLGISGMADYLFMMSIVGIGWVVVDYSFELSGIRDFLTCKNSEDRMKLMVDITCAKILLVLLCILPIGIIVFFYGQSQGFFKSTLMAMAVIFALVARAVFLQWFLIGVGDARYAAITVVVSRIVFIGACFLGVHVVDQSWLAVFFNAASWFLVGILHSHSIFRGGGSGSLQMAYGYVGDWAAIRGLLSRGRRLFMAGFFGNVYGQGSMALVGGLCPAAIAVEYGIWERMFRLIGGSLGPVSQGLMSRVVADKSSISPSRILMAGFVVWVLVAVFGVIFSSLAFGLLSGGLRPFHMDIWWIFLITSALTIGNVLMHPLVLFHGDDHKVLALYALVALVFLLAAPPLVLVAGGVGMAIALFMVEAAIFFAYIRWTYYR